MPEENGRREYQRKSRVKKGCGGSWFGGADEPHILRVRAASHGSTSVLQPPYSQQLFLDKKRPLNFSEMNTETDSTPEPLFRSVKRRKFLRRRPDHEQDVQENAPETSNESGREATTEETDDVVRLRRPQRVRKGGIEFSTTARQTTDNGSQAVEAHQETDEGDETSILAMCDRFTVHTGQTVDVDKHMYGLLPPQPTPDVKSYDD